jgi:hypothetical protein
MKKVDSMKKIFAIILLIILSGCAQSENNPGIAAVKISTIGNTTQENFIVNGTTAVELIKYRHKIETTYGNYIKCIDDVCVDKEYMWNFYINGKKGAISAFQYKVQDKDNIEWRFEKGWQ